MKKHILIFATSLLIIALLSGCGFSFEHEKTAREALNISQWPTPVPLPATVSPTPFPKSDLPPTAIPTPRADDTPNVDDLAAIGPDKVSGGETTEMLQQISSLTGGLTPVGAAFITARNASIRQEPNNTADTLDTVPQGDLTGILGQDSSGDWYYVITTSLAQGWLSGDDARVAGQLDSVPVLPNDTAMTAANQPNGALSEDFIGQILAGKLEAPSGSIFDAGLAPVAVFIVSINETTIRRGPGSNYGVVNVIDQGKIGGVLGQNAGGDWLYIITINNELGWLLRNDLRVTGTLAEAPVLPNDPIAALAQSALSSGATAGNSGTTSSRATLTIAQLKPVAEAKINNELLNMRQRPGSSYKQLGALPKEANVNILGLNRDREWALITTADGKAGWVSMDYLTVDKPLTDAPIFRTMEPENATDVAPVVAATGGSSGAVAVTAATVSGNTGSAGAASTAAVATTPSLPGNTLAQAASALINIKVDMRTGPGENYGTLDTATIDQPVTVLAVNPERTWALIRNHLSKYGWVPISVLNVTDSSLDNAQPVVTALVTSNNLPVSSGPGIFYNTIGLVNLNDFVSVLAINPGRSWVLVEPAAGGQGWIQMRLVNNFTGALNDLPTLEIDAIAQTAPTGPQPPAPGGPPTGKLVFQTSSGGDIMSINADGTDLNRITNGIDPVLSPNGQQIAFTRWQGETGTLWIANTDGSGERDLLGEMHKAKGPDWAPDGSKIVLNYQHGGRINEKRKCIALGSRPPMNATDFRVKYNDKGVPVGLCFTIPPDPHWSLRVVDTGDGNYKDLYGGLYAFRPAWDPNQNWRVVSAAGNGLLAVDINRDDYRQQITDAIGDGSPAFSPDGQFIAVTTKGQNGSNIYRMNADGGGRIQLTQTPLWEGITPDQPAKPWNNVAPVWSPDGSQIAFLTDRAGRWEIWLMNADGSNLNPMFPDEINSRINIEYNFVDERALSWR